MASLKIIKNNEYKTIPLKPGTDILFNKKIAEILDFDKTSNTYSYTIDVPETPEVNAIFEWANDYTQNSPYRAINIPAILESSGIPLKGFLKVNGHQGSYYQTQFVSGTFSWWVEIAERKLCQLGFTETFSHNSSQWQDVFAPNGMSADDTDPYVDGGYPAWASLKCFGQWSANYVKYTEMQLDFYARALVNKIFDSCTFSLNSNFLNSSFFRKVLTWISAPGINKKTIRYYGEETKIDHAGYTGIHSITNPDGAIWLYNPSNDKYTVPVTGYYNIRVDYSLLFDYSLHPFAGAQWQVNFNYTVNGGGDIPIGPDIFCAQDVTYTGYVETGPLEFQVGDTIKLHRFGVINDPSIPSYPADMHTTAWTGVLFENTFDEEGYVIDYADTVPNAVYNITDFINTELTVGDFMKGIIQAFNLQVATDVNSRTVTIEPYNDFYLGNSDYDEWTSIVDISSIKKTFVNELKRNSTFKFKDDSNDKASKDLYSYTHVATKRYDDGEYKSENPFFAATDNYSDELISTAGVYIPKIMNGDIVGGGTYPDKSYSFLPRILFKLGYQEYDGEDWNWATSGNTLSRIPKALQVGQGAALGFNTSLFADYYARNFQDLESSDKLNANVAIDFNRFCSGNFRKPKMIRENGQVMYYRLLVMEGFDANKKKLTDCVFQVWKR